MMRNIDEFLRGEELWGDNFSETEVAYWYKEEEEAYYELAKCGDPNYEYNYSALDWEHCFRHLPNDRAFTNVLGVGSGFGDEFLPISDRCKNVTILESSSQYQAGDGRHTMNITYEKADGTGRLKFIDNSFDLVTCFSVLHHIPNVSFVLQEIFRCLSVDGYLLIREPVVSMGDWRSPRKGLTKNERGIPLEVFRKIIAESGYTVVRERLCIFPLTTRLSWLVGGSTLNCRPLVLLDKLICSVFSSAPRYHCTKWYQKLQPHNVCYVLKKVIP